MKKILKQKKVKHFGFLVAFVIVLGIFVVSENIRNTSKVQAGTINTNNQNSACQGDSGNLEGYIDTDYLGRIYVDNESYETDTGTSVGDFYVNYDKNNDIWSGKGWSDQAGWVDFSYDQMNHIVRFVAPGEEYDTGCADNGTCENWGGWKGQADLSNVHYLSQNGILVGEGQDLHDDTGGQHSSVEDDRVGSGTWHFDHVAFKDPACPEEVHLFINESNSWYKDQCPANLDHAVMQWTSQNVHDCKSTKTSGFWNLTDRPSENLSTNVTVDGTITEDNSPVVFEIECTGDLSGEPVRSYVTASCDGHIPPPPCEGNPDDCKNFISPNIIEA